MEITVPQIYSVSDDSRDWKRHSEQLCNELPNLCIHAFFNISVVRNTFHPYVSRFIHDFARHGRFTSMRLMVTSCNSSHEDCRRLNGYLVYSMFTCWDFNFRSRFSMRNRSTVWSYFFVSCTSSRRKLCFVWIIWFSLYIWPRKICSNFSCMRKISKFQDNEEIYHGSKFLKH